MLKCWMRCELTGTLGLVGWFAPQGPVIDSGEDGERVAGTTRQTTKLELYTLGFIAKNSSFNQVETQVSLGLGPV